MKLTEDQIGQLAWIVDRVGYNGGFVIGGFVIKRSLFRRSGPINVDYTDQNRVVKKVRISSTGHMSWR